jgi:hypothetical protein
MGEVSDRPKWFAKNVRQVRDRVVGRPRKWRETVRSEMVIPSFSSSSWIRGAPKTILSGHTPNQIATGLNRCVVFRDVASDGANIDGRLRDAIDRQWLAGSAAALPASGARASARTAKTAAQLAKALIRTSENAELVPQGKGLEQ